jgi:beta-glucanase (GH16 family)
MTDPTPIFYDDFNSGLDPSKWQTVTANNWYVSNPNLLSWDANEFVPSNVSVSDGVLNLYADTGPSPHGRPWEGGMVCSTQTFQYGYIEAACKMPYNADGIWPAFWMNTKSSSSAWGTYPELDIVEWLGNDPTRQYTATHFGGGQDYGSNFIVGDQQSTFHLYGVDWEPTGINVYFDRQLVASFPASQSPQSPMQILFDNSVGGWNGNWTDSSTVFPSDFEVDSVSVWSAPPWLLGGGGTVGVTLNGTGGADTLTGTDGNDTIYGGRGDDTLNGVAGDDLLDGGRGRDTLTGGTGSDTFVFDSSLRWRNADTITDFTPGTDQIELSQNVFTGLAAGLLSVSAYELNAPSSPNAQIVYNQTTGDLFYAVNWSETRFAHLDGAPAITASDFKVI